MLLTPDQVASFGDWLKCDRIRRALVAARPELAERIVLDEARPLLRILRTDGRSVLVARTDEDSPAPWVVGVPGPSGPALLDVSSPEQIVQRVLEGLEAST